MPSRRIAVLSMMATFLGAGLVHSSDLATTAEPAEWTGPPHASEEQNPSPKDDHSTNSGGDTRLQESNPLIRQSATSSASAIATKPHAKNPIHPEIEFWVPRIGGTDEEDCDLTVSASDYASFLPVGDALEFTASALNECEDNRSFDQAQMVVTGPVQKVIPLYKGSLIVLPPSRSVSARVVQPIPPFAPTETYYIELVLYRGEDLVASTHFQFSLHPVDAMLAQIAPGGAGRFYCAETAPGRPELMFFGTDVGGVLRSTDGGVTFTNASRGLKTKIINEIEVVRDANNDSLVVYLATSEGVYRSDDIGETWSLREEGLIDAFTGRQDFHHPALEIECPAGDPDRVWVTLGDRTPGFPDYRPEDPFIVYRSMDGAATWEPVLDIARDDPDAFPDGFHDAMWSRVRIHPDDSDIVYIPSNRGLYATYDGGDIWYELGREELFRSADAGSTWSSCADPEVECESWMPDAPCVTGADCLPVSDYVYNITHPNLTDLGIHVTDTDEMYLYATIRDRGHMDDDCTGSVNDYDLERLTGGPWRSKDAGLTWQYLFHSEDDPNQYSRVFRCNEAVTSTWYTSVYRDIQVDPFDPDHIFIDTQWQYGGVIEGRLNRDLGDRWIHHTRSQHSGGDTTGVQCPDYDCFEGQASQALWGTQQFPSTEFIFVPDWSQDHPDFLLIHRGVIRGRFDSTDPGSTFGEPGRYLMDHLDSSPDEIHPEAWRGHALTDYCAKDMMVGASGNMILLSGADGIVYKSTDGGGTWVDLSLPSHSSANESRSCEGDLEGGRYYAQWYAEGKSDQYSIAASADEGDSWEVIGGYCDTLCAHAGDNGLPNTVHVNDLAIDWSSPAKNRRIFAGTDEGLYVYDPSFPSGSQWSFAGASGCPGDTLEIHDVDTFPEHPDYALITVLDDRSDSFVYGVDPAPGTGVYLVEMGSVGISSCTHVESLPHDSTLVRSPMIVALAELEGGGLSLVAAGKYKYDPRVWQTAFDFSAPDAVDWSVVVEQAMFYGNPAWADSVNWIARYFDDIAVAPNDRRALVTGMGRDPSHDSYVGQHLYSSVDGGVTWAIADEFDYFPDKGINDSFLQFSDDGRYFFHAAECAGVFKTVSPYWNPTSDEVADPLTVKTLITRR